MSQYPGSRNRQRQRQQRRAPKSSSLADPLIPAESKISPRGDVELGLPSRLYQPPVLANDSSLSSSSAGGSPLAEHITSTKLHHFSTPIINGNPAVDHSILLLSHGCCCCQCVRTQEIGILEEWGEFQEIVGPGCLCLPWPMRKVSGRLSLRVQQLDVVCESKTLDNIFCHVHICVMYRVAVSRSYEAFYRLLSHPETQMQAHLVDVIGSIIPQMELDRIFDTKQAIADYVFSHLHRTMFNFGYEMVRVLVTDIVPNEIVRDAMNEINACKRLKHAATHKAEATKVQIVTKAQAATEARYLHGVGTARERRAIVEGMKESATMWTEVDVRVRDPDVKLVMELLLVTQYMDMLHSVGANRLFLPYGPSEVNRHRLRQKMVTVNDISGSGQS